MYYLYIIDKGFWGVWNKKDLDLRNSLATVLYCTLTLTSDIIHGQSPIQHVTTALNLQNSQNMITLNFRRICYAISRRQIKFSFYRKIILSRKFPWNLQSICDIIKRTKTRFVDLLFRFLMSQIDHCYQIGNICRYT